ncbi:MAG TPA: hypothetical protein VI197_18330 [Polyangiaceae bacterium]
MGRVTWLLTSIGTLACSDGETTQPPPLRALLDRVAYHSDTDLSECPDAPEQVQGRLLALEEALGIRGPEHITYIHLSRPENRRPWPCPDLSHSCADGARVFSGSYVQQHEVVHATFSPLGHDNALLVEGAATAFGLNSVSIPPAPDDWRDLSRVPVGVADERLYASGAALVSFLYHAYGAPELVELYERAQPDPERFGAVFEDIYGIPLDTAWTLAHEQRSTYACVGLTDTLRADWVENVVGSSSCLEPNAVARHVFDSDGTTSLAMLTNYHDARVDACDPATASWVERLDSDWEGASALYLGRFDRGTYFISPGDLGGVSREDQSFRSQRGRFIGLECSESLEPLPLPVSPKYLQVGMRLDREHVAALSWDGDEALAFSLRYDDAISARWQVCKTCTSSCTTLRTGDTLVMQKGVTWLRAEPAPGREPRRVRLFGRRVE